MSETYADTHDDWERQFPSVNPAYDLAVRSYDLAVERADTMDAKIQSLMSLSAALTFAIPIVARGLALDFTSPWFFFILAVFVITMSLGIFGRFFVSGGDTRVVDPGKLYENNLHLSEWAFRKDFIYYAGVSFKHNNSLVFRRWLCAVVMSLLLGVEVLSMALWMASYS